MRISRISKILNPIDFRRGLHSTARAQGAAIVGVVNLDELTCGIFGMNPWFGTPVNPLNQSLIPGGSSSGSAAVVGSGEADVAFGTDTTGSIRIPAACCGVVGLRPTTRRFSLRGVYSAAPSFDTVGPLGQTVGDVAMGTKLLDSQFEVTRVQHARIGRFRIPARSEIDYGIDDALGHSKLEIVDVELPGWNVACEAVAIAVGYEYWRTQRYLLDDGDSALGDEVVESLEYCSGISDAEYRNALSVQAAWQTSLRRIFETVDFIAMPTLTDFPPTLDRANDLLQIRAVQGWSLAGTPALSMPVPTEGNVPASLQLIAAWDREEQLLGTAQLIEQVIQ